MVRQATNEELIASFLRGGGVTFLGHREGEVTLASGVWCWVEVDGVTRR